METRRADALCFLSGVALGAAAMYLADPVQGRRRRAVLHDKALSTGRRVGVSARATGRRAYDKMYGIYAETRARMVPEGDVADERLVQRVRAKMGRSVSHPRAVHVEALSGQVTLSGQVLEDELDDLVACVSSVRGVDRVENFLEVHPRGTNFPSLQG